MRIQEVCSRTGVTKRNIHFYIKEGLIRPDTDSGNGYYDFTETDCRDLILIRRLRDLGLSLSVIRSVLNTPNAAGYYLRIQTNHLKKEIERQQKVLVSIQTMLKQMPLNPDLNALSALTTQTDIPGNADAPASDTPDEYDNTMVNQILLRGFLPEGELSEYQKFIWEKINYITASDDLSDPWQDDYAQIKHFLRSLTCEQTDSFFAKRDLHYRAVASLDTKGCLRYVEEMKTLLQENLHSGAWINTWKTYYYTFFRPNARIFDSDLNRLIIELCSWFASYLQNIHSICSLFYQWLHTSDGSVLMRELSTSLNGYMNLEHCHHGELEAMVSFRNDFPFKV